VELVVAREPILRFLTTQNADTEFLDLFRVRVRSCQAQAKYAGDCRQDHSAKHADIPLLNGDVGDPAGSSV